MVGGAREAHLLAVDREDIPRNVVVIPHRCKSSRVGGGDGSELWTATGNWSGDGRDSQIVNHPPLIPTTLIIDHEKPIDVGEYVDECPHIIGIRRQTGLGLQNDPHSADSGQVAIRSGSGQHGRVVDTEKGSRKRIGLKASCVQQVILKKLARLGLERSRVEMSFGVSLCGYLAVRTGCITNEMLLATTHPVD